MAIKRPLFICSAITGCTQTANCCPHRIPHIKDERCIPKPCRFAPEGTPVDCVPYDPQALLEAAKAKEDAAKVQPAETHKVNGETAMPGDADAD